MKNRKIVILDLDNTLYDWNDAYSTSFMSLVKYHQKIFTMSEHAIIHNFKEYFKSRGTLELLPTLEYIQLYEKSNLNELDLNNIADKSCDFFLKAWKENINLYFDVHETLKILKSNGVRIVAFSDASMFWATYRLKCLKILRFFDRLYAPIDNIKLPDYVENNPEKYRVINDQQRKPNSTIIEEIINSYKVSCKDTFMIGDNLSKDIKCASEAGITSIWAKYGTKHHSSSGGILRNITPWEKTSTLCLTLPDYTIDSFSELLKVVL